MPAGRRGGGTRTLPATTSSWVRLWMHTPYLQAKGARPRGQAGSIPAEWSAGVEPAAVGPTWGPFNVKRPCGRGFGRTHQGGRLLRRRLAPGEEAAGDEHLAV